MPCMSRAAVLGASAGYLGQLGNLYTQALLYR